MSFLPRFVASVLVVLLATVAIGAGAYGLVLAIGRDPLPRAEQRLMLPELRPPDAPARLPAAPEFQRRARPANVAMTAERAAVEVLVPEPLPLVDAHAAGVAIYRADTGAEFQWLPLASAERDATGAVVVRAMARRGQRLLISLAVAPGQARHGYLERREVSVPIDGEQPLRIRLDAVIAAVRFDLPTDAERAGPLRLQRIDDPEWLPMLLDSPCLTLRRGTTSTLHLGRGAYRLCDALDPLRCQRFDVTSDTAVVVSPDLIRTRADRP